MDFTYLPTLYARHGFKQQTFATAIGKSQSYVSQVVNNKKNVSSKGLSSMASALGMTVAEFAFALEQAKEQEAITQTA